MTVLEIYERINLTTQLDERKFLNYLNDTMSELNSMYNNNLIIGETQISKISSLKDSIVIEPLYHISIVDNILFSAGAGDNYKGEFLRKAKNAYTKLWSDNAKGKRIKRNGW